MSKLDLFWLLVQSNSRIPSKLLHQSVKVLINGFLSLDVIHFIFLELLDINPIRLFWTSEHQVVHSVVTRLHRLIKAEVVQKQRGLVALELAFELYVFVVHFRAVVAYLLLKFVGKGFEVQAKGLQNLQCAYFH